MLCQICKVNPASIHIQEIVGGKKQTLHLCLSCAGKKSLAHAMFDGMDLGDILNTLEQNLAEMGLPVPGKMNDGAAEPEKKVCPVCSWRLEQFRETGRLGCPACYTSFAAELKTVLASAHRACFHTGKLPLYLPRKAMGSALDSLEKQIGAKQTEKNRIEILEHDLAESVRREEYELAAELRDRIEKIRRAVAGSPVLNPDGEKPG